MSGAPIRAIEARRLQISAGTQVLLQDISLTITAGERVVLVGHNGAGKSTLLRALSGFSRVTRGKLRVLDTDLSEVRPGATLRRLRSRVAQVHRACTWSVA